MTFQRRHLGISGEDLAVEYLQQNGYKILERNFRSRLGEIDIVARDKDTLCFVEVKTRTSIEQGHPFESVSFFKQRKLARMALSYLKYKNFLDSPARFDVIAILFDEKGGKKIELIQNAFEAQ